MLWEKFLRITFFSQESGSTLIFTKLMLLIFLIFSLTHLAYGQESGQKDWQTVNINGEFTFEIPSDMKEVKVQGIDSFVKKYENAAMTVSLNYGAFSDPLEYASMPGYGEEWVKIDGKEAKMVQFPSPGGAVSRFN